MKKNKNPCPEYFNKAVEIISRLRRSFFMKKTLTIFLLFLTSFLFAQNSVTPNQFDRFINAPSIEWAAYINYKARFEKDSFNKRIIYRLIKKEIAAAFPIYFGSDDPDQLKYLSKEEIDSMVLYLVPIIDSAGNASEYNREDSRQHVYIDSLIYTDIIQILYIEDGKLQSYIPWIAPMKPVITSMGTYLGDGDYFSTCFNFKHNYRPKKKNKPVYLSETKQTIDLDSAGVITHVKQFYSRTLVEALWPYILEGRYTVFTAGDNRKLKKDEVESYLLLESQFETASCNDSIKPLISLVQAPVNIKAFSEVQLIQDWYYDQKKNIVFSRIKELCLHRKKLTAEGGTKEIKPVLKIVFN